MNTTQAVEPYGGTLVDLLADAERAAILKTLAINLTDIPLNDRQTCDLELLANFFLRKYSSDLGKKVTRIDPAALRLLESHSWPGNIRELENAVERAIIMAETDAITPRDLHLPVTRKPEEDTGSVVRIPPGGIQWEEVEKDLILQALEMAGWIQKEAARLLGLSSRVLNYKIKQFGITHPTWKQNR